MTPEASTAPDSGHGAETPSPASHHWLEAAIPEDAVWQESGEAVPLREHPALKKYGSVQDMAEALVSAQNLIGRKTVGLVRPPQDAGDEEHAAFDAELRRLLEVPDDPEGYDVAPPDGGGADERLMGWFKRAAHEIGLSPAQARGLAERYNGLAAEAAREAEAQRHIRREESRKAIEALWGPHAGANVETARRGFTHVAERTGLEQDEIARLLDAYGDDAVMIRLFHEIGKAHREDGFVPGLGGPRGRDASMTPQQFFAEVVFGGKGD